MPDLPAQPALLCNVMLVNRVFSPGASKPWDVKTLGPLNPGASKPWGL